MPSVLPHYRTIHDPTDLAEAVSPDQVPRMLRRAAELYRVGASELSSAWQDKGAGSPWLRVAEELERCAQRLDERRP